MRWAWLLLVLAGCSYFGDDGESVCTVGDRTYRVGDSFPAGDGCNSCSCTAMGVACTGIACVPTDSGADAVDADPAYCGPTNGCPAGPACGTVCCGQGERCASGVCVCGTGAACTTGNTCAAAGPVGGDVCGSVCCGTSGPCPQ